MPKLTRFWPILLALAGCATTSPLPDLTSGVRTVTVDRIVKVPCVVAVPDEPVTAMPIPGPFTAPLAAGARLDVEAQDRYIQALRAALMACATTEAQK